MKKLIAIIFMLIVLGSGNSQNYLRLLDNFGHANSTQNIIKLQSAALKIDSLIPLNEANRIKVYDFRNYIHNNSMSGANSVSNLFQNAINKAEENRFYILFNFNVYPDNKVNLDFKMVLPKTGNFSCLDDIKLSFIESNVLFALSNCDLEKIDEKLLESLNIIYQIIENTNTCCDITGNRLLTTLDPDKIKMEVYLADENSCPSGFCINKENDVTYFRDSRPKVYIRLKYEAPLFSCVDLKIKEEVQYKAQYGSSKMCHDETYTNTLEGITLVSNFPSILPSNQVRAVLQDIKFGGRIKLQLLDQNNNVLKEFKFTIKGKNPKIGSIMQYIDSNYPKLWMLKYITMAETGLYEEGSNAASDEAHHFRRFQTAQNSNHMLSDYHLDWSQSLEFPNLSFDCGFGTMQLTDPKPSIEEMWNWKKNVDAAAVIIQSKKNTVKLRVKSELLKVDNWNTQNIQNQVLKTNITYSGHDWSFSIGNNFINYNTDLTSYFDQNIATGEHSILDAGLILYFNGSGNHHFLQANTVSGSKPVWKIVDTGYGGTKYINKTMSTIVPIY